MVSAAKVGYHHGDLRAALLEAALAIITEVGPRGLSIREVARRAGVSHAAPYRHFKDKDELILAVVEQGFALLQQTMAAEKAAAADDPISQFAASGLAYVQFALNHPAYYRVMFSGDLLSSDGNVSLQHTSTQAMESMVADIAACQKLKIVRAGDPLAQAVAILSTVHGFVSLVNDNRISHLIGDRYSIDAIRDLVLTAIFEGIGMAQPGNAKDR